MGKRTKTVKRRKTVKCINSKFKTIYKGGVRPECEGEYMLTQFQITDANIASFMRNVLSPFDCVINALQLIGMLDMYSANLLRITIVGQYGIDEHQIKKIFILYYGYNFEFEPIPSFQDFSNMISCLEVGNVAFAGYQDAHAGAHIFLIGRKTDGLFYYIEPQRNTICNLSEDPECLRYIANKQVYYLLKNNLTRLTDAQFREQGFVNIYGGNEIDVGDFVMGANAAPAANAAPMDI